MYRQVYYEVLDLLVHAIEDRFNQLGYKIYCHMESLLLKAIRKEVYSDDLTKIVETYATDFNVPNLQLQLNIFSSNVPDDVKDIFDIKKHLQQLTPAERELISEVVILMKLILVMPATNSTSA